MNKKSPDLSRSSVISMPDQLMPKKLLKIKFACNYQLTGDPSRCKIEVILKLEYHE